jgi:hypothetical protein
MPGSITAGGKRNAFFFSLEHVAKKEENEIENGMAVAAALEAEVSSRTKEA